MKKVKGLTFMVIALLLSIIMSACSSAADVTGKKIVSLATVQPEQHPIYKGLLEFQDHIHEHLGDEYEVNIFSSGVIGDNPEVLELLQMGSLDLAVVSGSNMESFADEY